MADRIFIRPAPGRLVHDPHTLRPLAPEGAEVVSESYWLRRLAEGDVVEGQPPAADAVDEAEAAE